MAGTKEGGLKTAATIKERYGDDHYKRIGSMGQAGWARNGRKPRGFSVMTPEQRQEAGRKGGTISKRRPANHSKIEAKEIKPPVWQPDQNSTDTSSTLNTTKQKHPCVSCGSASSELDEMGLCPNCPDVEPVKPSKWYHRFLRNADWPF